jgi:hypothetical protein
MMWNLSASDSVLHFLSLVALATQAMKFVLKGAGYSRPPDAAPRIAKAARWAADPGSRIVGRSRLCVAALRVAPRPGQGGN